MKNKKIIFLMILCSLFWSGAFIAGKICSPFIPAFTLTFLRFSIATIVLFLFCKIKDQKIKTLTKKDIPVFLFTGILGMVGYHVLFFTSLKYTTAVNASLIGASNPIFTVIISFFFLKDKLTTKRVLGIILSFTGVVLTITNVDLEIVKSLSFNKGDLIMLVAVLLWASYSVFSKMVMKNYTPITLTFYSFLFCTIFLIPFVIYENPLSFLPSVPTKAYIAVIYMAIFPSVIGYLVQQYSIKEIGPAKTSIFINLVPVFSIILSVVILNEQLLIIKVFTAALIIVGVLICQKS
jgi:drug/metabolite transporter (DMT)-like permease